MPIGVPALKPLAEAPPGLSASADTSSELPAEPLIRVTSCPPDGSGWNVLAAAPPSNVTSAVCVPAMAKVFATSFPFTATGVELGPTVTATGVVPDDRSTVVG